jgi:polo-like kinase 1
MLSSEKLIEEKEFSRIKGIVYTRYYRKDAFLGSGGFGDAYECTALDTNESYAIKELSDSTHASPRLQQGIKSEMDIHASLKHDNVCQYVRSFTDGPNKYMVMELCSNNTLADFAKRRGGLSIPEIQFYMRQLINAVSYLHDNSVIHRDLKPENLFLDDKLNLKVGDFGLATRLNNPFAMMTEQCGTRLYLAPEVIGNRPYSFPVDIWSMGVILYKLLLDRHPFAATSNESTEWKILTNDYSFPNDLWISWSAKELIGSMLHPDPDKRPSLNEISRHPFFRSGMGGMIPKFIPLSALDESPKWEPDSSGFLVPWEPAQVILSPEEYDDLYAIPTYDLPKCTMARRATAPTVALTKYDVPTEKKSGLSPVDWDDLLNW